MPRQPIAPLTIDQLTAEQKTLLKPVTDDRGRFFNIFGTLIRNTELFKSWAPFGQYTMNGSRVDPINREILILRVAANVGSDYEWAHHLRIGMKVGLTDADIKNINDRTLLDSDEKNLMVTCADELTENYMLSDDTWNTMLEKYGFEYTTDVIYVVGAYTATSMALKSCGVQVEGGH